MKFRVPAASKDGSTQESAPAPARQADALGPDLSALPPLEVQDLPGRPLPLAYVVSQQLAVFTILFTVLGVIETWLLPHARVRRLSGVTSSWLRRGWWLGRDDRAEPLPPSGGRDLDPARHTRRLAKG